MSSIGKSFLVCIFLFHFCSLFLFCCSDTLFTLFFIIKYSPDLKVYKRSESEGDYTIVGVASVKKASMHKQALSGAMHNDR
jgi:hypothetical protein